jgi:hypothetical protein
VIPAPPNGPPKQWTNEFDHFGFAGRNGPVTVTPPYGWTECVCNVYYFNGLAKPTSSIESNGQPRVGAYVDPTRR